MFRTNPIQNAPNDKLARRVDLPLAVRSQRAAMGGTNGRNSQRRGYYGLLPLGEQGDEVDFYLAHAYQARNLDGRACNVRLGEKLPFDLRYGFSVLYRADERGCRNYVIES